jgi:hypothetical protein
MRLHGNAVDGKVRSCAAGGATLTCDGRSQISRAKQGSARYKCYIKGYTCGLEAWYISQTLFFETSVQLERTFQLLLTSLGENVESRLCTFEVLLGRPKYHNIMILRSCCMDVGWS